MHNAAKAVLALLALTGVDALLWQVAQSQLSRGVDRWEADAVAHGWSLSTGARHRGGWPFAATLTLTGLHLEGGQRLLPGGLAVIVPRLQFELGLAHPITLWIDSPGPQRLRLSHAPDIIFHADRLQARIPLGRSAPAGWLEAENLQAGLFGGGHPTDVQIDGISLRFADETAASRAPTWISARIQVAAHGIALPDIGRWPLGAIIASAAGSVSLDSPRLYSVSGWGTQVTSDPKDQARLWRDGGGALNFSDLAVHWGPMRLAASAQLNLDANLQPAGIGRADIEGSAKALDALASAGVIQPGLAATAKAILAVMPSAPNNPSAVHLPFVLRDNTLSVGKIPVVRVNEIAWNSI